jgi:hypothetical protein
LMCGLFLGRLDIAQSMEDSKFCKLLTLFLCKLVL